MKNGIHFISGLPRSGSTLLAALLLQNPALHAGITSGVGSLVGTILREVSQGNETAVMIDDGQRQALLRGVFENYYHAIHPIRTVFDTNRVWTSRLHLVADLFPNAKVICCVRNMPWIIDSIERLVRRNRWELSRIFDFDPAGTAYSRADGLSSRNGLVGFAYNAMKQAMHSEESDRLLLLTYETLSRNPAYAMERVYDFVGLPRFTHNFENISFDATEFDARLGTPGLHKVQRAVRAVERQTLLPPDLWRRYEGENFWHDAAFNKRGVRIV
ncbi:sulfotransferase [Acidisphaera sp. S103]|uniref:sulfotransferase family protein n=1 Tax=Acidisphaera sp. S103 TaxID=1747223 RepID=UPI00131ADA71|nr:sulfotransferase [Acidisphaera sp. S103]